MPLTGNWQPFVAALSRTIQICLPPEVSLFEDGQRLVMTAPDEVRASDLGRILDESSVDPVDRAVDAARHALADVQDFVVRASACPWPGHGVAEPGARALNSLIYLWYGDEDFPVLRLEPIPYSTEERPRRAIT